VDYLWYWDADAATPGLEAIMPSRTLSLLINLSDDQLVWYDGATLAAHNHLRGIAVCGAHTRRFAIDAHQPKMMGVKFTAGGAWPFFGLAAREFTNRHVALKDVWGAEADRLNARLLDARTIPAKFDIVARTLLQQAARSLGRHPAVDFALARFERAPFSSRVSTVAARADVGHKRFISLFEREVGVPPKLYLRMTRFQNLLERISAASCVDWAEVVENFGYVDQSHFIRDFREFSGFTPSAYMRHIRPSAQHVSLSA
jgi:AraC-like DNA-binding protein